MPPKTSFGALLRRYRTHTVDPYTNKPLSQERLAEFVNVAVATISYWENDQRRIRVEDRALLLAILQVLHRHGGIKTVAEANALLLAGGYAPLGQDEREENLPDLIPDDTQDGGSPPKDIPVEQPYLLFNLRAMLFKDEGRGGESTLAAAVLYWLGSPAQRLTAHDVLRLIGFLFLWLAAALAWWIFLQWPYHDDDAARLACLIWGGATALVPILLGLAMRCDHQDMLQEKTNYRLGIVVRRITGALGGYQMGAALVFATALLLFYLALWPLPRWLVVLLAGLPMLLAYAAGRRMPYNYYRAFRDSLGETRALRLDDGDLAVLLAFLALGPMMAALFYFGQDWLLQPVVGATLLGGAIALVALLQIITQRRNPGRLAPPPELVVLLAGIPLSLWMMVQPGAEPILGGGLLAGLVIAALLLSRQPVDQIRLTPLLAFTAGLLLLWAATQINVWLGRAGLVVLLAACWRWWPTMFRPWLAFWLLWLLLLAALLTLRHTSWSPGLIRTGFALAALLLIAWTWRRPRA